MTIDDGVVSARWGALAQSLSASSCLAAEAPALAEAGRQMAFKSAPVVEEQVVVETQLRLADYRGRVWTISSASHAAYKNGVEVFVLGGVTDKALGVTRLDVLRRLA